MAEPQSDAEAGEPCFLGVVSSLRGKRWTARPADERESMALAQRLGVPEIIGRVLSARGVGLQEADDFLHPTLKRLLPDPSVLKDMDTAALRLAGAVTGGEQIAVFGDYDVDGATSSALLARLLSAVGGQCRIYIPDRGREGYGPNEAALLGLKDSGVSLVVTVDCGIAAHAPLAAAADAGLDVIVVDHHAAEAELPRATAVINPNRLDESGELGQLAAVGVSFLLAVAVNRALRALDWYQDRPEPDLRQLLDLVALGTVCDVVPLRGVNRALVSQGLKVMGKRANPGLRALADAASLTEAPGAYHLGFILGPRINAGGRVGSSELGARLLSTDDEAEAKAIASRLEALNAERRDIEAAVLERARDQVERSDHQGPLILAAGEGWHGGVIGIVASRLKERFHRPAFVVSIEGETATGSGRSVHGVDLGQAVIAARQAGLVVKGGGHPMAAGFTAEVPAAGRPACLPRGPHLGFDGAGRSGAPPRHGRGAQGGGRVPGFGRNHGAHGPLRGRQPGATVRRRGGPRRLRQSGGEGAKPPAPDHRRRRRRSASRHRLRRHGHRPGPGAHAPRRRPLPRRRARPRQHLAGPDHGPDDRRRRRPGVSLSPAYLFRIFATLLGPKPARVGIWEPKSGLR